TFGNGLSSEFEAPVSTHAGAVAAADLVPRPRRGRRLLPAIAGLVVTTAVGAAVLYFRRGPAPHSVSPAIAEPASASAMVAPPEPVPVVSAAGSSLNAQAPEAPPAAPAKDARTASSASSRAAGGR